jgi:hypothetical protein
LGREDSVLPNTGFAVPKVDMRLSGRENLDKTLDIGIKMISCFSKMQRSIELNIFLQALNTD